MAKDEWWVQWPSVHTAAADDAIAVTAAKGCLHARDTLVRHALEETDVEAELVPLDRGS